MSHIDKINKQLNSNNQVISTEFCRDNNIPTIYLSRLVKKGELYKVARGLYSRSPFFLDNYYSFQYKNKRCIYSFHSALYLLDLSDRIPEQLEVTVYSGYNAATSLSSSIIIHYIKKDLYPLGITDTLSPFGNPVQVYNRERTICDLIANRDNIEAEVFHKAIHYYIKRKDKNLSLLSEYSIKMKIEKETREILELIYE